MVLNSNDEKINKKSAKKILFVFLLAGFLSMLNETALNIAFPTIMIEYNIPATTVQWLTTIFVFVTGIVFIISAYLIERFTTKKLFITAMLFLIIGTIVTYISTTFVVLIIGRIIQAIGTGIIVPLLFNSVLILSSPEKRGITMGLVSLVVFAAPMIAPVVMGSLMSITDWHNFFILIFILFIISTIIGLKFLQNINKVHYSKLDVLSIILVIIGFGGILYTLSEFGISGLCTTNIISVIIGILAIALFIRRQLRLNSPLLDLHVFKYSFFNIGLLINLVNIMIIFAIIIVLPMYLQTALHTTSLVASLVMLPGGILNCILSLVSGKIYDKQGPKLIVSIGLLMMAISLILLTHLSITTTLSTIVILTCIFYSGSALLVSANQTHTLGNLPVKYYASGSAIMTSLQQMGGAIGSSLFVSLMTIGQINYLENIINPTVPDQIVALVSGVNFSFEIASIIAIIAFILSLFTKSKKENNE
ncbi:MAG: DHA2 family efflux MFS transporter permease subunit [Methanobacteriaceae archaeon]|nr:DHA2 family efflux MFS transporter permease subunit [Methanobacteriaceae archaeon]